MGTSREKRKIARQKHLARKYRSKYATIVELYNQVIIKHRMRTNISDKEKVKDMTLIRQELYELKTKHLNLLFIDTAEDSKNGLIFWREERIRFNQLVADIIAERMLL